MSREERKRAEEREKIERRFFRLESDHRSFSQTQAEITQSHTSMNPKVLLQRAGFRRPLLATSLWCCHLANYPWHLTNHRWVHGEDTATQPYRQRDTGKKAKTRSQVRIHSIFYFAADGNRAFLVFMWACEPFGVTELLARQTHWMFHETPADMRPYTEGLAFFRFTLSLNASIGVSL